MTRTVSVELLSLSAELAHLLRAGTAILLGVWLYLAAVLTDQNATRRGLLPYQALIQSRPAVEQRLFRELQEGLLESEAIRSRSGAWPDISDLAGEGIPPFAPDPTARAAYRWQLRRDGSFVNYLGFSEKSDGPAWLLLIQEPAPGIPPDQTFEDEEHHRLLDGTMLHVSTWQRPAAADVSGVLRVPQTEGWTQLYAVGP
jgi:hypothetical protein